MSSVSYEEAQGNLAGLWDRAISTREPIVVHQAGKPDIAIIAAEDISGYLETAHLLSSQANAKRLIEAMEESRQGIGVTMTLEELRAKYPVDGTDT